MTAGGGGRGAAPTGRTGQLFKSTDEGLTWKEITGGGLPPNMTGRTSIAVAMNTNAQRMYPDRQLRSLPFRRRRRDLAADGRERPPHRNGQGGYNCGVYVDPKNPDIVYTINTSSYQVDSTAATRSPASRARRAATIRSRCGSIRPTASGCCSASIRAPRSRSTAA